MKSLFLLVATALFFFLLCCSTTFIVAQEVGSSTPAPTPAPGPTPAPTPAPPGAPEEGDSSAKKFGISTATFFSALVLWCGVCYVLAKMEDKDNSSGAAAISGAQQQGGDSGKTAYAADNTSPTGPNNTNTYSSASTPSTDAGYMPVAIPDGQNRI